MKSLLLAGCLLMISAPAKPQGQVAGKWLWQGSAGWQRVELDLNATGAVLTGTIRMGPEGVPPGARVEPDSFWRLFFEPAVFEIRGGRIRGNSVAFEHDIATSAKESVRLDSAAPNDRFVYSGEVDGNTLKLTRRFKPEKGRRTVGTSNVDFILERVP